MNNVGHGVVTGGDTCRRHTEWAKK